MIARFLFPILLSCGLAVVQAYEMRTWTNSEGVTVEAQLVEFDGQEVTIRNPEGREFTFDKSKLSQGDLAYLEEYAEVKKTPFGRDPEPRAKVANPAMDAKIDDDRFVEGEKFEIPDATFETLETDHFKILHTRKAKPEDLAELAERMWIDTAYFHEGFASVFTNRKMALFLVDDESTYLSIGEWFASLLAADGHHQAADNIRATWPRSAAGVITFPAQIADGNGVLTRARVFKTYRDTGSGRPDKIRGVWVPFRVHCIARDLLGAHVGGVANFADDGWYALNVGYGFYKEIQLAEKSETSIVSAGSGDVSTTGGFSSSQDWPDELRDVLDDQDLVPTLEMLWKLDARTAQPLTNVLAYSFAYFLHSTPDRVRGWNELMKRLSTSNQMPPVEDTARLLGFESAEKMERQWVEFIDSRTRFK